MDVDLDALRRNFEAIRKLVAPASVMPVVKANAYGHGLVAVGRALVELGADSLGVACLEEGLELRRSGIRAPILVFGGIYGDQIRHFIEHDLEMTASSIDKLEAIEACARSLGRVPSVHIKIDTGMERIGVHHYSCQPLLERAKRAAHCKIRGIFSHFACADDPASPITGLQLERFLEAIEGFQIEGARRHIANSAAMMARRDTHLDVVRPGLALYGVYPYPELRSTLELAPVMSITSRVVYFKVVKKGAGVSYGHTWTAPSDTRVVTLPIGYGDGYPRRLSNKGEVLVRGIRRPIVGNVCMDQFMVDIGSGEAYNGDEVVVIGSQGGERITVEELAEAAGAIPHEILASMSVRIPRRYSQGGRILESSQV